MYDTARLLEFLVLEAGRPRQDPATHPGDLMDATLPAGTRRTIGG